MQKQELITALEKVKPGLANKDFIEQSTSFAFMDGKVITYNDEISISHPVKDLKIEGAVQAEELYQFLSKTKTKEIKITTTDNEVQIKSGKSKAGLTLHNEIKLPLKEMKSQGKWKSLPDGIIEAMKFTMFSCSRDMSKPVLTCVNVTDKYVEASDNFRITRYKIPSIPVKSFLIPVTSVRELIKYEVKKIAEGEGWIHFKTEDGTVFSCRIFEDTFPDVSRYMKVKGETVLFPRSIKSLLDQASVFVKEDNKLDEAVAIFISDRNIRVKGKGDAGWFEGEAKIQYKGSPISFSVNPTFLQDILDKLTSCIIGENVMKFSGNNWDHVISLNADDGENKKK